MEEVAPGTVVGVEAVGIAVVVVEVVGTDLAEELVLGTVVEEVHPEESKVIVKQSPGLKWFNGTVELGFNKLHGKRKCVYYNQVVGFPL